MPAPPQAPAVNPGGNEQAAPAPAGGGAYQPVGATAPGAAHAVQSALGAALGAKAQTPAPAVGGNITAPTGGAGLPAATAFGPPPSQLAGNPAYVAFLNSLGLSDADLQNQAAAKAAQDWIAEQGNQQADLLGLQNAQTRTANEQAGQGLENSSQALNAQALLQQGTNAKIAALQNNTAGAVNNIYATLAAQQATGAQNLANAGTNIAGASYIQNAVANSPTGAFNTSPSAAAVGPAPGS